MASLTRDTTEYSVSEVNLETDRAAVIGLWRAHLATPAHVDAKYQWFYCDAPGDAAALMFLCHGADNTRVGVAGVGTRSMQAFGRPIPAGVLVDFVVAPDHRTVYPATLLQQRVRETQLGKRVILYGTPNEKSLPIVQRLGYVHVGDLRRFVSVLRFEKYLGRKTPRFIAALGGPVLDQMRPILYRPHASMAGSWRGEWLETVDGRFDELWQRASQFEGVIGRRDQPFLRWRFGAQPGHTSRIFVVSRSQDAQRLAGYAFCETTDQTLSVRDLLVDPALDEDALRVLFHLLSREAYREGCVNLSCEILGTQALYNTFAAAGLVERERTALYAAFAPQHKALSNAPWYMTKADFDV